MLLVAVSDEGCEHMLLLQDDHQDSSMQLIAPHLLSRRIRFRTVWTHFVNESGRGAICFDFFTRPGARNPLLGRSAAFHREGT